MSNSSLTTIESVPAERARRGLATALAATALLGGVALAANSAEPAGGADLRPSAAGSAPAESRAGALPWVTSEREVTPVAARWVRARSWAAGMRIRSRPVNGTIVATVPYGRTLWVRCLTSRQRDGYTWGRMAYKPAGRWIFGWSRSDLWSVVQNTGPGGGGTPSVPRC